MGVARTLGIAFLAGAVGGCGGQLAGGTGGTGGGIMTGSGGTSDGGGTGDSRFVGTYTWGDVTVQVAPPHVSLPSTFSIEERDLATPDIVRLSNLPAATKLSPSDGAYATAWYGCTDALDEVDLYNCADAGSAAPAVDCVALYFREGGVVGSLVESDGTACQIESGQASLYLPPPPPYEQPDATVRPPGVATGIFVLDCVRSDGGHRQLTGRFQVPLDSRFLIC